MSFRDWAYFITAMAVICFSLFRFVKNRDNNSSYLFMAVIVVAEIMSRFLYGNIFGETMPSKVAASINIIALLALLPRGGGVIKLVIMSFYGLLIFAHYFSDMFFQDIKFPYLHFVRVLSYTQLVVLLFLPKIESFNWYGEFSKWLINRPILGIGFSYYISNHFNGLGTAYQRETKNR